MALVNTKSITRTIPQPIPSPPPQKKTHSPCLKIARHVSSSYLALLNRLVEFPAPMKNAVGHQEYPFSLVGNIGIYKPEERTDQKGSMDICLQLNKRLLKVRRTHHRHVRQLNSSLCLVSEVPCHLPGICVLVK